MPNDINKKYPQQTICVQHESVLVCNKHTVYMPVQQIIPVPNNNRFNRRKKNSTKKNQTNFSAVFQ